MRRKLGIYIEEIQSPGREDDLPAVPALGMELLDAEDREILVLRHFEQMSGAEAALVLGIEHDAARKRYSRAVRWLRRHLEQVGAPEAA